MLGANLLGTAIAGGADRRGAARRRDAARMRCSRFRRRITELGPWETFVNAIPAGFLIAILAWSLPNAREQAFWVIFAVSYVVAIGGFSHSIVGSDEAFLLMFAGEAGVARGVFELIAPAVLGNLVGGAGLFALLAHAQVRSDTTDGDAKGEIDG